MNRAVFVLLMILCLLSSSSLTGLIRVVKAQGGTITINADGSISPSSAPISSIDNLTYTLTGNVSYPTYVGIVVERSNIIINGNGYTVQGNYARAMIGGPVGLNLQGTSNVTLENVNFEDFYYGIKL